MFKEKYDVSKNDLKLSTKLFELRKKSELSQTALAKELHVDRSSIQRWESGRSNPSEEKQVVIEEYFGLIPGSLSDFKELRYSTKKVELKEQEKQEERDKKTCSIVKCGKNNKTRTNEEEKAWQDLLLFDVGDIVKDHTDGIVLRVTRQTFKGDQTFEGRVIACDSGLFELGTKNHDWLTGHFALDKKVKFSVGDIVTTKKRDQKGKEVEIDVVVVSETLLDRKNFEGYVVSTTDPNFRIGHYTTFWNSNKFALKRPITDLDQTPVTETYNPIKPTHYLKNTDDLIESWFRRYPLNEFRAIMKSNIERYTFRYDQKNGEEDLKKAQMYIKRLLEYEEKAKRPW